MRLQNINRNARAVLKAAACEVIRRYHQVAPEFTRFYSGTPTNPGPVFAKEADFLYTLARILMPNRILEIGLGGAASTLAFAEALRQNGGEGRLVSIDTSHEMAARANILLKMHGLKRFATTLLGSSDDPSIREQAAEMLGQVDILLIDGDHSFDGVVRDFQNFHTLVAATGVIIFHDTGPFENRYADQIAKLPREHNAACPIPTADGRGVYHRPDVARAVDWILEQHPEYGSLAIHNMAEPSCGIAILQRRAPFFSPAEQP